MPANAPAEPKGKGYREPAFLSRTPITFYDPIALSSQQWRHLVGAAPVVRSCIATLIMQITGLNWEIVDDDKEEGKYFELVLGQADDGSGFENMIARVLEDALTVPFGGAWEIGSYPGGGTAWTAHLDGGLLRPTYNKDFPYAMVHPTQGNLDPRLFRATEVSRIKWMPRPEIRFYGWTRTPCMDCLAAIQGLLRSDRFWQTLLTDNPPPGILDVMGMSHDEAVDWLASWKTMLAGIDSLKVPILTAEGRDKETAAPAQFISFGTSAAQAELPELVRRYAEMVCAAFGMNTGDLGLFNDQLRVAGATRIIDLSKRQGLAHLLKRIKQRLDMDVLPDGAEFKWADIELEDVVRKAAAKNQTSMALGNLVTAAGLPSHIALQQAIADGIITVEVPEELTAPPVETPPVQAAAPAAPEGAATQPTGQKAPTTTGETQAQQGRRASPKAPAPQERGDKIPPRAFPTSSKAARELGKIVGPWMNGIARSVTKGRIGDLLDAGLAAATKEASKQRAAQDSPAAMAIRDLLEHADWWKTPDIGQRVANCLSLAYGEGLLESAQEIQDALHIAGVVSSPALAVTTAVLKDPATLGQIAERGAQLVTRVDEGTKFFITQKILGGVDAGISSPSIARTILVDAVQRGVIETFRGRSLSIVNTEINAASTSAALAQQASVGLTRKHWIAIPGVACNICQSNMDQGPVAADFQYESVFDEGIQGPPAHPHVCHCYVTFDKAELLASVAGGAPEYWFGEAR
jgi:hypothetical protein